MPRAANSPGHQPPILLVKWYDVTKWLLERVENFPKNQRFIFGQRLADRALGVLELLVEAAYSPRKADLLAKANRELEVLRWLRGAAGPFFPKVRGREPLTGQKPSATDTLRRDRAGMRAQLGSDA